MNVLKIKQMGKRGLKLRVDKKTRNKRYTAMAYLRRHGYAAKGRDVLLKEGSPKNTSTLYSSWNKDIAYRTGR